MAYDLTVWIVNEGHKARSVAFARSAAIELARDASDHDPLTSADAWWAARQSEGWTVTEHDVAMAPASHTRAAAPSGWKMVPTQATPEMLDAAKGWREGDSREGLRWERDMFDRIYHRMVSASPSPSI